jgi:hypothetical protein
MKATTRTGDSVLKQIADLDTLSHDQLCELWRTLYGKEPMAFNRPYLIKRLAYRIQELAYGGLSDRAHKMMDSILESHGFDENGGSQDSKRRARKRRNGMPIVGARLVRKWNAKSYEVIVTHSGFEYEGKLYGSLTAITKVITGTHWNGRSFFGLKPTRKMKGKVSDE